MLHLYPLRFTILCQETDFFFLLQALGLSPWGLSVTLREVWPTCLTEWKMLGSYGLKNNPEPANPPPPFPHPWSLTLLMCILHDLPEFASSIKLYLPIPVTCSLTPPFHSELTSVVFVKMHLLELWLHRVSKTQVQLKALESITVLSRHLHFPWAVHCLHLSTAGMLRQAQAWEAPGSSGCWMCVMDLPLIFPKRS